MNSHMPKGGRRPGAGAPRGNLNHLTWGRKSNRLKEAIGNALQDPKGRVKVLELIRKYGNSEG